MAQGSSLDGLSVASTTMDLDNDDFDKHRVKVSLVSEHIFYPWPQASK